MTASEPSSLIPITLLTGFLGSGKTTVLNHVLKQPDMAATAVIVNEFGEIGLDHPAGRAVERGCRIAQQRVPLQHASSIP
jgi:G3E family GTPase